MPGQKDALLTGLCAKALSFGVEGIVMARIGMIASPGKGKRKEDQQRPHRMVFRYWEDAPERRFHNQAVALCC